VGYAYAVIGGAGPIPNSTPGIYPARPIAPAQ